MKLLTEREITQMMVRRIQNEMARPTTTLTEEKNDRIVITGRDKTEQEEKFTQYITPRVTFNKLIVFPYDNNVVWSGKFDNGIQWKMEKNRDLQLSSKSTQIDDEELEIIDRLTKYSEAWKDDWADKLRTEYKVNGGD